MNNEILDRLKTPAIGLIVMGFLNALTGILVMLSVAMQTLNGALNRTFTSDAEQQGFYVGFYGSAFVGILSLILAPIVIFGGLKMLKGKSWNLAITAAVLATIPFSSCCFVLGAIFGIWALMILIKPDIKAFFQSNA